MAQATMSKTVKNATRDFSILKSDDLYIGGYASIEVVDKQNDLITLDALSEAVKKYMSDPKYRNVMTNHSNVQVGEVVKEYRDKSGRLWKTDVDDVGFFVVIKLRDDIEKAKEVGREIRKGTMRSFSIGGQALEKRKRNNSELGDYNEISKLELHEVTICEKGINPEAKFDILKQDKGVDMTDISKAISELNTLLKNIEKFDPDAAKRRLADEGIDVGPDSAEETDEVDFGGEHSLREFGEDDEESLAEESLMDEIADEREIDARLEQGLDSELGDDLEDMEYMDTQKGEKKMTKISKDDGSDMGDDNSLPESEKGEHDEVLLSAELDGQTQVVGEAGEVIHDGTPRRKHKQGSEFNAKNEELHPVKHGSGRLANKGHDGFGKSVWTNDTPTLDLSVENIEKAYAEFKAEQMEKLAYEDVKRSFQARFDAEVAQKTDAIAKAEYDPRTEVNELKKQFSDLLDTLKGDAEMTIRKQEEAVANLNIPSADEIAKMDWNDIHLTMQRLEENY